MNETLISSESIYNGRIVNLRKDTVSTATDIITEREVIEHVPVITVLPFHSKNEIILIKQFRHATKQVLIEAPAGCIEMDEDPLTAAKRELEEETGYQASTWIPITSAYPTPGFCDELIHFYLATDLTKTNINPDEDECIQVIQLDLDTFKNQIKTNQIKTVKPYYHITF